MKKFDDNDIEVLGSDWPTDKGEQKVGRRLAVPIALGVLGVVILLAVLSYYAYKGIVAESVDTTELDVQEFDVQEIGADPALEAEKMDPLWMIVDSINDVVMEMIPVDSKKASVTFELPDSIDHKILLATPAADYRADNGEIVGEFIYDKKQLTRGIRKKGWCYVTPAGTLSIGIGDADEVKERALAEGGCFFRQYPLVMDGEICNNVLKGKAKRRALGFIDGRPLIVKSVNRESMYDFSMALADYGFSYAMYLPGGDGLWLMRSEDEIDFINEYPPTTAYATYLIFTTE